MKCTVCHEKIKPREIILIAAQAVYNGPSDDDVTYQVAQDDFGGAIHKKCLQSSGEAISVANTGVPESTSEELLVRRSDALALFGT
jgi:hypothetical protein